MIRHNGYRVEIHKVVTSDDYVLTLHRVLPPDGALDGRHATPVILQHGVLADSTCWMCNGPEHSFAFILVDAGSQCRVFTLDTKCFNFIYSVHTLPEVFYFSHTDIINKC